MACKHYLPRGGLVSKKPFGAQGRLSCISSLLKSEKAKSCTHPPRRAPNCYEMLSLTTRKERSSWKKWVGTFSQQLKFQEFPHYMTLLLSTDTESLDLRIGEHEESPLRLPASREGAASHFPQPCPLTQSFWPLPQEVKAWAHLYWERAEVRKSWGDGGNLLLLIFRPNLHEHSASHHCL